MRLDSIGQAVGLVSLKLESMGQEYEIIVVDDGSVDGTKIRASECALNGGSVKVIGYDQNMGKGFALMHGAMCAKGDFIFFMDSDLDIEPLNLSGYLNSIKEADLVIASKRHPRSRVEEPMSRRVFSLGFHKIVKLLVGIKVSDTQSGLKGFRSESLRLILPLYL